MAAFINNLRVIRLALLLILVVSMVLCGLLEREFRNDEAAGLLDHDNQRTREAIESIMSKIQEESQLKATQRRVLLLRNRLNYGHANQQQCLHLASALAVQYNRTLLLPHDAGCRPNNHQNFSIPMNRLYNIPRAKRMLDFEELALGEITPSKCSDSPNIPFSHTPDFKVNASDPFSDQDCIIFDCEWAARVHAPASIIPHIDEIYFRYHDRYWDMAKGILSQIIGSGNKHILAIQIRRGDMLNMTLPPWPVLNCPAASDWMSRLCRRFDQKRKQDPESELTWNELFQLLAATTTNVDAIFVATNDVEFVHKLYDGRRTLPPLYMMPQFIPQIRHLLLLETLAAKHLSSTVELLVVEQIILALADYFVPSYLSTIPDHVFRMRLYHEQQQQRDHAVLQREQRHYNLYANEFSNHCKVTKAQQEVADAMMASVFAIMMHPDFVKKKQSSSPT